MDMEKNIKVSEFKVQKRGGVGVKCIKFRKTLKDDCVNDGVISHKDNAVMIITEKGTMCKQSISTISTQRREAMGVTIMKLDKSDSVISMQEVNTSEEEEGIDKEIEKK